MLRTCERIVSSRGWGSERAKRTGSIACLALLGTFLEQGDPLSLRLAASAVDGSVALLVGQISSAVQRVSLLVGQDHRRLRVLYLEFLAALIGPGVSSNEGRRRSWTHEGQDEAGEEVEEEEVATDDHVVLRRANGFGTRQGVLLDVESKDLPRNWLAEDGKVKRDAFSGLGEEEEERFQNPSPPLSAILSSVISGHHLRTKFISSVSRRTARRLTATNPPHPAP